jgi:16S rRNA processing protein RimM
VDEDHLVALGRVTDAYGVKGWIRIQPYGGAGDSALLSARQWTLRRDAAPASVAIDRSVRIEAARNHSGTVVAKPHGSDDRSAAETLKGAEVWVRRGDFPAPPEGEYYWVDLVGCEVLDPEARLLGRVESVDDQGAHALLSLDGGTMIPFVDAYVLQVDLAARRIVVDWRADWSE